MKFVNFELLRNPVNWVIVWLMLAIGAIGVFYIAKQSGVATA